MTLVTIVAIADIALIVLAFAIVLANKASGRRELRKLRPGSGARKSTVAAKRTTKTVAPYRAI